MTRIVLLLLTLSICIVTGISCLAAEQSAEQNQEPTGSSQHVPQQQKPPSTTWPYQFQPSSEINADAQVSFPADI